MCFKMNFERVEWRGITDSMRFHSLFFTDCLPFCSVCTNNRTCNTCQVGYYRSRATQQCISECIDIYSLNTRYLYPLKHNAVIFSYCQLMIGYFIHDIQTDSRMEIHYFSCPWKLSNRRKYYFFVSELVYWSIIINSWPRCG